MRKAILCASLLAAAVGLGFGQELVHKTETFAAGDEKFKNRSPIRWYSVKLKAANRLAIRAASIDFTPLIVLSSGFGNDVTRAGTRGSASFSYSSDEDATIKVGVTATGAATGGSYFIRIAMVPARTAIKLGDRVTGELAYDDEVLDDRRPVEWYATTVKKGQHLAIASWSDDFNPSIVGTIPGGVDLTTDESAPGHGVARFTAPQDGELRFGVAAEGEDDAGTFNLQLIAAKDARSIGLGETVSGSLRDADDMFAGKPMDAYRFHGKAGTRVVVTTNASVDTTLAVQDASGRVETNDDTSDTNSNARISHNFTAEGDIEIRVSPREATDRGDYKVSVAEAAPLPALKRDAPVDGILSGGDELQDGKLVDRYLYTGTAREQVEIGLASDDFDSVLQIIGVNGENDENDDIDSDTTNSSLIYTFPRDGTMQVIVTTLDTGEKGSYTLTVSSPQ